MQCLFATYGMCDLMNNVGPAPLHCGFVVVCVASMLGCTKQLLYLIIIYFLKLVMKKHWAAGV